jgi:hypothetical protein
MNEVPFKQYSVFLALVGPFELRVLLEKLVNGCTRMGSFSQTNTLEAQLYLSAWGDSIEGRVKTTRMTFVWSES